MSQDLLGLNRCSYFIILTYKKALLDNSTQYNKTSPVSKRKKKKAKEQIESWLCGLEAVRVCALVQKAPKIGEIGRFRKRQEEEASKSGAEKRKGGIDYTKDYAIDYITHIKCALIFTNTILVEEGTKEANVEKYGKPIENVFISPGSSGFPGQERDLGH